MNSNSCGIDGTGIGTERGAREGSSNRKARQRRARALLAAAAAALLCYPQPGASQVRDEAEARRQLSAIKSRIEALQAELRAGRKNRSEVVAALEASERAIATIAREQRRIDRAARVLEDGIRRLRLAAVDLQAEVELQRAELARQLRMAYALGRQDRLRLLLNREPPERLQRLLRYHDYFSRQRRARIQELDAALARLRDAEGQIAAESARLDELRARRAAKRQALDAERGRRAETLSRLEAELADRQRRLASLQQDRRRLGRLVARLRRAINDIPPELEPPRSFRALRGRLPWPVRGRVLAGFGTRRADGNLKLQGVLLDAARGSEVRAVSHGRVVFADWLRGFGLLLILDHGDGYMSLYGHNQSLLREPGEWVNQGDALATVGDSGGQAGSALYFEIRHDGRPQDPARWCSTRARFRAAL